VCYRFNIVDGSVFYHGSINGTDGSAFILASRIQLNLLRDATDVAMDATFQTVPRMFYQLFAIFVSVHNYTFPVIFVLMSRKTQGLYAAVFRKLKGLVPEFKPRVVMADYEDASTLAFQGT
jgi:hypothetical protein